MATPSNPSDTALVPHPEPASSRDVDTVPFVELADGRVQGVVSASSDVERVYCAFLEAGTGVHYSSTNNNRPDAGTEKRMRWLVEEAVKQYGAERIARYLEVPGDPANFKDASSILGALLRRGGRRAEPAGVVFSRFLNYLRFLELESAGGPVPEMAWFVGR
jgi:hypothetical protein